MKYRRLPYLGFTQEEETPKKKRRLCEENDNVCTEKESSTQTFTFSPEAVLGDDLLPTESAIGLLPGIAARMTSKKHTQFVLKFLTEKFTLPGMAHVKRVRSIKKEGEKVLEILLFIKHENFAKYHWVFEKKSGEKLSISLSEIDPELTKLEEYLDQLSLCNVASKAAVTKQQFILSQKYWPVSFHEDKEIAKLVSGEIFTSSQCKSIDRHMKTAFEVSEKGRKTGALTTMGVIIVDPRRDEVIATANDLRSIASDYLKNGMNILHPLQHAVMVAIDLVARAQGGGIYSYQMVSEKNDGIYWNKSLTQACDDKSENYDAEDAGQTKYTGNLHTDSEQGDFYICTGYDAYITHEPCVMCAMALLHSRISRVFYAISDPLSGGLGGRYKLHAMKQLNHRFNVFKCTQS